MYSNVAVDARRTAILDFIREKKENNSTWENT